MNNISRMQLHYIKYECNYATSLEKFVELRDQICTDTKFI